MRCLCLAVCCVLLVVADWSLFADCCLLLCCLLCVVWCLMIAGCCSLCVACCLWFVVCCLFVGYCMLIVAGCWLVVVFVVSFVVGWLCVLRCLLRVAVCWLLIVGCWLVVGRVLLSPLFVVVVCSLCISFFLCVSVRFARWLSVVWCGCVLAVYVLMLSAVVGCWSVLLVVW